MCFSMAASITAGGVLTAAGAAALRETADKHEVPLAAIPLFFGIQQIAEGFAWHALVNGTGSLAGVHTFLFFAYFFWPTYVPLMVLVLEDDPRRRLLLGILATLGFGVGLYLFSFLLRSQVLVGIAGNSIAYDIPNVPFPHVIALYTLAVCISPLVSSVGFIRRLGVALIASLVLTAWFFAQTFTSVWCFFAALLSLSIWWHLKEKQKSTQAVV